MWRTYNIRPQYGNKPGLSKAFYAPGLDAAFKLARIEWPGADSWECTG